MKQTKLKLKTAPRIILIMILVVSMIKIYTLLGNSSNWYEFAGWMVEFDLGIAISILFAPFNDKLESWIKSC